MQRDEIARKYTEMATMYQKNGWMESYVLGLHWKRRGLFQSFNGHILDVACGTGENFPYFPAQNCYTAIDYTPAMLDLAEKRAQKLGLNMQLHRMDAEQLEFADASFEAVVSTMSTCTFPDPIAALREMARVCQPQGRIILIEHGRSSVGWLGRYQDRHAHSHYQSSGCRWNQAPLDLVKEAGLQIISAERSFFGVVNTIIAAP